MSKNSPVNVSKEIQKLECIGKTGKVNKFIEFTQDHLAIIKINKNDFSLRVIAYIIKGIFLIFKKNYEYVHKDLQAFIEIYINGKKNKTKQEGDIVGTNIKKEKEFMSSFKNISLLSENNSFENFLNPENNKLINNQIAAIEKVGKNNYESSPSKMDLVNKIIEKSIMTKSRGNKTENFDNEMNMFDDLEKLDDNFAYSRNVFSNFINFNIDDINNALIDEDSKSKTMTNLKDGNMFKEFEETKMQSEIKKDFDYRTELLKSGNKINLVTKARKINTHFTYDNNIEIENKEELLKEISNRQNMRKNNLLLFNNHFNKIILEKELENFSKSIEDIQSKLYRMKLNDLEQVLSRNYLEEENTQRDRDYSQRPENFRHDNTTTAKKRRSIDTSAVLSSLSLNEVFEHSTDKKLLNNHASLFNDQFPDNNIIIEEDSNFNMNTFSLNLKSNFNNLDLEFADQVEESKHEESSEIDIEVIKEHLGKTLNSYKKKRKSTKGIKIDLVEMSNGISEQTEDKRKEVHSIMFYQLLLKAQTEKIPLVQNNPFEDIYIR